MKIDVTTSTYNDGFLNCNEVKIFYSNGEFWIEIMYNGEIYERRPIHPDEKIIIHED